MKKILSVFAVLLALTACNSNEPKAETAATTDGKAIVEKLRHHDDSIQLWKYLNR